MSSPRNQVLLAAALLGFVSQSSAQQLQDIAKYCYATTDLLAEQPGSLPEYAALRDHLASALTEHFNINKTDAKIKGMSELKGAANLEGVTVENMALAFYKEVCKPVFVE